ncbi:acyltransferase [Parashewanella spongiae]|uniref:Acyltransferase n=1 Tax=Parashewanella spongiae TaxID=342950 RepID=A0A3A6TJQ0_9GAMM|nr:acyltransferase [Parashewanella spongiae]MCL1079388.1 acyltransferase [Parashewanella spongiae]RJY07686.1 acyltransferase [Parashewanella spongiae]
MLSFLPAPVLYVISGLLLILNTFLCTVFLISGGVLKLILPFKPIQTSITKVLNKFMWAWASGNGLILKLTSNIEWDVEGLDSLNKNSWYLVICNHVSGFDIAAQTYVLRNHIPMLKFFLKRELIFVPFMGLGCWALDMPFMNRTSSAKLKKNPKLRGKDLATTRRSCEKFKRLPTSIMNYVEGSRFTEEKRERQNSPYQHLLRPKAAGIAFALSAMGEQFSQVLNMTLVYPDTPNDTLAKAMSGKLKKVVVRIEALPVPEINDERYFKESEYRVEFQRWLNGLWAEKDTQIDEILSNTNYSN